MDSGWWLVVGGWDAPAYRACGRSKGVRRLMDSRFRGNGGLAGAVGSAGVSPAEPRLGAPRPLILAFSPIKDLQG